MKAILVLLGTLTFAASPFLSDGFNGFDPDRYPVPQIDPPVQPIGWAFSIWGIIYLALIAHAAFGVLRHRDDPAWEGGRSAMLASLVIGSVWIPVANASPVLATVLLWLMLATALLALNQTRDATPAWAARWAVALYAGWLSAAGFVSIGLLLAGYGVTGEVSAAFIALVLATAFIVLMQRAVREVPFGLAAGWGVFGITIANLADGRTSLAYTAGGALILIVAAILVSRRIA